VQTSDRGRSALKSIDLRTNDLEEETWFELLYVVATVMLSSKKFSAACVRYFTFEAFYMV
jgi:hypothetical protein